MTHAERIERARRAGLAMDEFFTPALNAIEQDYAEKMVATAASTDPRAPEIINRLATAIKVGRQIRKEVEAFIADGQVAKAEREADRKLDEMSEPQKRLLRIAPN